MADLTMIAAVAQNGVIGNRGSIPWDIPGDRAHFARTTAGGVVIMGRRTWQSIPGGLPGRLVIVLTRRGWTRTDDAVRMATTFDDAISLAAKIAPESPVFVAGGAEVYAAAMPLAGRVIMSRICRDFDGDTTFPGWYRFRFAWPPTGVHGWDWRRAEWQTSPGAPIPWRIEHWWREARYD